MFDIKPVGKHKIAVCTNLPCALRDGEKAGDFLKRKLGVDYRETTPDGLFTLVEGECMGACGDSRSEEHTSELQSLMRISYAVFCLKKKKNIPNPNTITTLTRHKTNY